MERRGSSSNICDRLQFAEDFMKEEGTRVEWKRMEK